MFMMVMGLPVAATIEIVQQSCAPYAKIKLALLSIIYSHLDERKCK